MKPHYGCPVQATIHVVSGKWKVQILWHLSFGPSRFAELKRKLKGVSEKVLAQQLRQLQGDGLLNREAEVIGVSDHLARELPLLIEFAANGKLDLNSAISRVIPLDAEEINRTLDRLENFGDEVRVVIRP